MQQYLLVLLGVAGTAALWVLFQLWLQRQEPHRETSQTEAAFLCRDCEEPCGKQIDG